MLRDFDLSFLRNRRFDISKNKQGVYRSYAEAIEFTNYAFEAMNAAWAIRKLTREAMLQEQRILEEATYRYEEHWHSYEVARDEIRHDIDAKKEYSNYQHQQLLRCRMQSDFAYSHGDKISAKELQNLLNNERETWKNWF